MHQIGNYRAVSNRPRTGVTSRRVVLRGGRASITWAYHTAAVLRTWTLRRGEDRKSWILNAGIDRADPFQLKQSPLLFTAPRKGRIGLFCFPVKSVNVVGRESLSAVLGPPEY